MTDTGKTIAAVRRHRGLRQSDLAERVGLSREAIHTIETGKRRPSTRALWDIAAALDVPAWDLIENPVDLKTTRCWWPTPKAQVLQFPPNLAAYIEAVEGAE